VTKVTVTVGITPDNKCECDEKFTSQLRPPTSGNVSIGVNDTATITIVDDDEAFGVVRGTPSVATVTIEDNDEVQVQFNPAMHTVEEIDGIVVIPIECGSCADSYTVSINCSDGTAESNIDYVAGGTLEAVCEPGSNTSVLITLIEDILVEQMEMFTCQIVDPPEGVSPGPNDVVKIIIMDDEEIVVNFNPVEYSTKEDDGNVTLTVVASAPSSEQYSVFVDTSDGVDPDSSATSSEDYTPGPYEVVFPPGVTKVTVTVGITPDNKCECDEKFTSQLRPPTSGNVSIGVNDTATITIVDDDEAQVQFNPAMHTVKESDGIVTIPIECGSCAEPYTVSITCSDGTAEANIDYVAGGTLEAVCKPGSNTSVLITLIEDILVEQMEMFTCQIVDPPEGVSPGPNDVVKIIIMDDEEIVVNFNPVEYSTKEDDGNVTLTVVASAPSSEQYSVFVDTSDGVDPDSSATSSEDYTPGPYEVVFPPGVTKVTVTINITRDDDCECDEEFTAQLLSPSGDVGIGVNDTASITIVDDDACRIMFCPDEDKTVDESVGSAEVCVCVEKNCIGEFQVCMNTTDGEDAGRRAVAGDDYESGPYCVDFAEGQNKSCVQIPIIDDDIHEPTQDFDVSIDVPDGLPLVPGKNITITITDDDPVICMIEEGSLVVLESDGTVTVGISINREIEEPVDCLISTSPVTALDNDDFEPFLEKRVTFEPQKGRSQMVSLQIIDDENPEPTENLRIEAKSGDLQIAGGNGTDPTTIPAINITIIDDDDRCQLTQNGIISTFFEEAMFVFNRSCPFEMVATCPQGGQDAIPFQIQIDLVNENTDSARVAIEFDKSTVVIGDDGRVTMLGNGEGIEVTQSSERVIVQVEALDVTVTRTLGEGGQVTVSTSNTSDLVQTNQLCGLCGNEKGMLIFKDGSPVPSEDPVEVSKFLEELSVSRSEQLFGDLRSECGGEAPQIRNDTIIGDPLYEVPLRLSKELTDQYGELSLCYEVHGRANSVFNLISDICVCVNAHYAPMIIPSNGNIINQIGVVAEDSTGQCQRIQVNLTECAASVNGVSVTSYNQNGISVIRRSGFKFPRVRISVPNCENIDLVMWVVCEERSGQPMIKFVVARGHNLTPTSHGLIGQFWNIDVSAEKYTVTEEDRISPSDTHFAITVRPPSGSVRRFFADIHPETWDLENRHCLYAGSGQGGRTYEVPSLPDTVIEGRYSYYKTDDSDLFQCAYRYSRFESVCPSVPN
jgi:predicted secreted protein